MARQMRKQGVQVRIVPLPDRLDVYDKKALDYSLVDKARSAHALLHYNRRMRAVVQECQADGMWARGTRGALQIGFAARWNQLPLVWDIGVEHSPKGMIWGLHALSLFLSEKVVTQAQAQPEIVFGCLLATSAASKFEAIYPGIAPDRASQLQEAAVQSRGGGKHLITVGSIHPRKNQLMTLRAFARIHQEHPEAKLDLAGSVKDNQYFRTLKDFVGRNRLDSKVRFLGWREDIPDLLGRSDGLILSSQREGIPHVVREAMYAEVPVIATAVGGVPEAIEDGETGFLVPPNGTEELAERIDDLLSNPEAQRQMGKEGFRLAQRRFSWNAWLAEYADLLHGLSSSMRR